MAVLHTTRNRSRETQLMIDAERAYAHALSLGHEREGRIFKHAAEQTVLHNNPSFFEGIGRMKRIPVTIDEFVDSKEFLAGVEYSIWPTLREDLRRMNPDVMTGATPIYQTFLGGATGTGKSHLATGTVAYQTYFATCFDEPQRLFGLTPMTPMVAMLQSVSPTITKRVLYEPFRKMFTNMSYVRRWCGWNKYKESVLELDGNIQIVPAAASLQTILGQAVFAAILDEVNFMLQVENSKMVAGPQGMGGKFDQAEEIFSNIERRRTRSFTTRGISIGNICVVSSTRYKNDFLDRKIDEVDRIYADEPAGTPKTFLTFRHKQYEVNPRFAEGNYPKFRLLVGTDEYGTRVLEDYEEEGIHYTEGAQILMVPMPYKAQFKKDPEAALRDVVGIATDAISPFFRRRGKITEALDRGEARNLLPWTERDEYELAVHGMPEWNVDNIPDSANLRQRPHHIHIDLSKNKDRCGVGVVRLDGFINQQSIADPDVIEQLPKLTVVAAIGIKPTVVHEIDIAEVRAFALRLISLGINVEGMTFDGFQSGESIQMTRKAGIYSEVVSVGTGPYEEARDVLYQDRLDIQPGCGLLQAEMNTIEYYPERNVVDHPPRGTKDVLDGVVGAIHGALNSRAVRTRIESVNTEGQRVRSSRNRSATINRPARVRRPDD